MTTPSGPPSSALSASTTTTTTRTCIKNLPPSLTETKLKSHLQSSQPTLKITDCKILKTKDGKSRKIAFVGFQTSSQAEQAVSYFDKSFAGTARLSVSLAFSKKKGPSSEEYRPWSKHSAGSSRYAKLHEKDQQEEEEGGELVEDDVTTGKKGGGKKKKSNKDKSEDLSDDHESSKNNNALSEADRKKEEFLSAMGLSKQGGKDSKVSKSKFWANDDAMVDPGLERDTKPDARDDAPNKGSDSNSSSESESGSDSDGEDGDAPSTNQDSQKKQAVISDLDFLKSKQVKADILSDDDDNSTSSGDSDSSSSVDSDSSDDDDDDDDDKEDDKVTKEGGNKKGSTDQASSSKPMEEDNRSTNKPTSTPTLANRLFVRNLPFTTAEEDLFETFSQIGDVTSVHIPVDDTKRNKGYAFINFSSTKDAKLALETMDGGDFQGRLIHILPARPSMEESSGVDINDPNLTYKERQVLLRQKEAEKSNKGWSASFLRGDAVVDNISDRLGVSKGDVLNVKDGISSGNAAVRLALGETHIISENIAFFESHGVDVTALESSNKKGRVASSAKRSKTMVLVKNLPYDTSLEDLTKVFQGIGGDAPKRILLPPSKTAALVEYGHATDARRAFRRLAYKKFKHVPLYLEWAPMKADGERQDSATMEDDATKQSKTKDSSGGSSEIVVKKGLVEEDTVDTGVSQTIYVKNLNFSTSEDKLKKAFAKARFEPRAVKIPTKAAPTKKQKSSPADSSAMKQVSMGFGFVEFSSEEEALKAMKSLQGQVVDGHALEIKLSTKSLSSSSKTPAPDKSSKNTKIMVRNVPFEATRTELLQLFGSFGQLKKVRLPKKFDGTHRGFAFCEFVTSKEAQNAMTTLSRTHLYGRHLVLEWASAADDDGKMDVGAVREKAKRDALAAGIGGGASKKKGKHLKF